jgi:hypothetical protein
MINSRTVNIGLNALLLSRAGAVRRLDNLVFDAEPAPCRGSDVLGGESELCVFSKNIKLKALTDAGARKINWKVNCCRHIRHELISLCSQTVLTLV